jgi:small-conductance mechanosensitive channel
LLVATPLVFATQAATEEPAPEQMEPPPPPPPPIAASDIPVRSASEASALRGSAALLERSPWLDEVQAELSERQASISQRLASLRDALRNAASLDTLDEIDREWRESDRRLERWGDQLRGQAGVLEQELRRLDVSADVWERTVQEAVKSQAPSEIVGLSRNTASEVVKSRDDLRRLHDRSLGLLGQVGLAREAVQEARSRIEQERGSLLTQLVRRERDPLWSEAVRGISTQEFFSNVRRELERQLASVASVWKEEADRVGFQLLLLVLIGLFLLRTRTVAQGKEAEDRAPVTVILDRPFSLALLLSLLATRWLYVSVPAAMADLVGLLLIVPVVRLILPLSEAPMRPALLALGALYVVDHVRDLVEAAPLAARLLFLLEMLAAAAILAWMIRSAEQIFAAGSRRGEAWRGRVVLALEAGLVVIGVAALATVAGFVRLGVLLGSGVLNSAYLAVFLLALTRIVAAGLEVLLSSRAALAVEFLGSRREAILARSDGVVGVAALATWILSTLDLFALLDPVARGIRTVFVAKLQAGALSLSLADVLAFIGTILAAILLARLVTTVLEEDVYPRVKLGRGVGYAVSTVVRYGVLLLGFVMAVGAMGLGMDRITVLLGAFGVGLGFGLQNVVNNFVSGLILIFERPVQVGDSVEVASVKGKMTRIGIRSSTVRTFEGADVTVPNGTLLSDAVTNWTMSDRVRRIELAVGVAYGTNPDVVIEVLREAEARQQGLVDDPAPQVLFVGFGESSLDFLLRAWVADNDAWVTIRSELALAVNRGLAERGVEIPFPQRDLHLRSIAPELRGTAD